MPRSRVKRKSIHNTFLSFFFLVFLFFVTDLLLLESQATNQISHVLKEQFKKGRITVITTDELTHAPIKGAEYVIVDKHGEIVDVFFTDKSGIATSRLLNYRSTYKLKQREVPLPYKRNEELFTVEIIDSRKNVIVTNQLADYIENYNEGDIEKLLLSIPTVMQYPELPHGCEITSLTAVLNYLGYDVSKTYLSDQYLPKEPFARVDGKLYGANPYLAYAGEPRHETGFFSYPPPIIEAADTYFRDVGGKHKAYNISGSSKQEIIEQLNKGIPVVIWVTLDLSEPRRNYSWYFHGTDTMYEAPTNLHAVVLKGYKNNVVYVMDPLKGSVTHDAAKFFDNYHALGGHALIVTENWNFWQ